MLYNHIKNFKKINKNKIKKGTTEKKKTELNEKSYFEKC